MAYFDNAATTYPKPEEVYTAMDNFSRNCGGSVGRGNHARSLSAGAIVAETRKLIQEVLHCPAKQVVFTPTATIALNIIIQGLVQTGLKSVYISPFEHNAVTRTLQHLKLVNGIDIQTLAVTDRLEYDFAQIGVQFSNKKPDLLIVSHVSNVIGLVSPVENICELAKKHGAFTVVDMAQSAGLIDLHCGRECFDFAVFAGHKTLYGPTGISGFIMKPEIVLPSVIFGGTGYDSANQNMPSSIPERFEMGTMNTTAIAGLNASLKWIQETSISAIHKREIENREKLLQILSEYEFVHPIGLSDGNQYSGIVSVIIAGISSDSAGVVFAERGIQVRAGLQCAPLAHEKLGTFPAGTVRFSVSYFTTEADFDELRNALDDIEDNL